MISRFLDTPEPRIFPQENNNNNRLKLVETETVVFGKLNILNFCKLHRMTPNLVACQDKYNNLYFRLVLPACGANETLIWSPWIWSSKPCSKVIGDPTNHSYVPYRQACGRWLGYGIPNAIEKAYAAQCVDNGNRTTRYRSQICCPGNQTRALHNISRKHYHKHISKTDA